MPSDLNFSDAWLTLREPFDHSARENDATRAAVAWSERRPTNPPLKIADLGAGAGSNLRFLAPRLAPRQHWTLIDHDRDLLARAAGRAKASFSSDKGVAVETECSDLVTGSDHPAITQADLVTASALLDLVTGDWLDSLIDLSVMRRAAMLFALTYDGRMAWRPALPDDGLILELFHRHQQRNKGFGPALGPTANDHAAARLAKHGYLSVIADSAWQLTASDDELLIRIIDGCADAAEQVAPRSIERIAAWRQRRSAAVEAKETYLTVGHTDLWATPA